MTKTAGARHATCERMWSNAHPFADLIAAYVAPSVFEGERGGVCPELDRSRGDEPPVKASSHRVIASTAS